MKKLIAALALMFPVMSACAEVDHSYPDAAPVDGGTETVYRVDCADPPDQPTLIPIDATATGVTLSPTDYARVNRYMQRIAAYLSYCFCRDVH